MRATIDGAGRIVIPKSIRDRQRLRPGTEVVIIEADDRIELILPDDREDAVLVEEEGHLVVSSAGGQPLGLDETLALRDALRERSAI